MLAIKHVLHPTDFSDGSELAFRLACSLARDYGARLSVVHVALPPTIVYGEGVVPPEPQDWLDLAREKLARLLPPDPKIAVDHRLIEGDVVDEILRTAADTGSDVIVMGTHGRTGLGRFLMGSVAEQVVRKAPCPVVTVKTPLLAPQRAEEAALARASS
jgi:nucleotide-binding universal stress UspA family protein